MHRISLLTALLVCSISVADESTEPPSQLADLLSADAEGYAKALEPREFVFPDDHGPHESFRTEWWYFTGNLRSMRGERFGYQLTLFRIGLKPGPAAGDSAWRSHQLYMGHLAISDIERQRHLSAERFSRAAAGLAGAQADPLRIWLGPWSISGSSAL